MRRPEPEIPWDPQLQHWGRNDGTFRSVTPTDDLDAPSLADRDGGRASRGAGVDALLALLTPRQREVFTRRVIGGEQLVDIARSMGVDHSTAVYHYQRAVAALRGHLEATPALARLLGAEQLL